MIEIRTSPTLERFDGKQMVCIGGGLITTVQTDTLVGADLSHCNLDWAYLPGADLRAANFSRSSLCGANLRNSDLTGVDLQSAILACANLSQARLQGARLQGADLRFAHLEEAALKYARYDETPLWPEDFDPQERGAKLPSQVREWQV